MIIVHVLIYFIVELNDKRRVSEENIILKKFVDQISDECSRHKSHILWGDKLSINVALCFKILMNQFLLSLRNYYQSIITQNKAIINRITLIYRKIIGKTK